MPRKKKGDTSLPSKSDVLAIRISPKLRYGLDLLARKQHRSVTGVVEWAIEKGLNHEEDGLMVKFSPAVELIEKGSEAQVYYNLLNILWDPDEIIRLLKLDNHAPDFMTFEEQKIWGLISKNAYYWKLRNHLVVDKQLLYPEYGFWWDPTSIESIRLDKVHEDMPKLQEVIKTNENPANILPVWVPCTDTDEDDLFTYLLSEIPEGVKDKLIVDENEHPFLKWDQRLSERGQNINKLEELLSSLPDSGIGEEILSLVKSLRLEIL